MYYKLQYVCTLIFHYNIHLSVLPIGRHHINVFTRSEEIIHNHDSLSSQYPRNTRSSTKLLHQIHCIETMKLRFLVTSAAQGVFCKETP